MTTVIEPKSIEQRFVDQVSERAKLALEEVIGEVSFDVVHGYMNSAVSNALYDLKLTKQQQQSLEQHFKI